MTLKGKVALVTGGGTGVGAQVARALTRDGAAVVIAGRRREKLDETASTTDGKIVVHPADVSDELAVERLVEETVQQFGRLDILVNNAGIHARPYRAHELPVDVFDRYLAIDLRAPFLMMRAVLPHMLAEGDGSIVNIASIAGLVGLKYTVAYAAAKGGLVQMTRELAVEYAADGVRVNCLCPGAIRGTESLVDVTSAEYELLKDGYRSNPSGRRATTEEIAETIVFLAGPHSAHITGAIIPVDGGYTAQ